MLLVDSQVDRKDPVVVGHSEVVGAIGRPGEVDGGITDRLVRVVYQPRLNCGVLSTVEARDIVQLEIGGSDYGDVGVCPGRCQHRSLIACEVVVRISEVGADAKDSG